MSIYEGDNVIEDVIEEIEGAREETKCEQIVCGMFAARELALVLTKLDEALMWAERAKAVLGGS